MHADDATIYAYVRALLRHLGEPECLRGNAVLAAALAKRRTRRPATTAELGRIARALVEETASRLPFRSRAIVLRCDIAGELHGSVASSMGISERHFYRERRAALVHLGRALLDGVTGVDAARTQSVEPSAASFAYAQALIHAGRAGGAVDVLASLVRAMPDCVERAHAACCAAHACCESGGIAAAEQWLSEARRIWATLAVEGDARLIHTEIRLLEARLAFLRGDLAVAETIAQRAGHELRAMDRTCRAQSIGEGIVEATLQMSELRWYAGAFAEALVLALEARDELCELALVRPALHVRTLFSIAHARLFIQGSVGRGLDELADTLRFAQAHALAREAVRVSALFCPAYVWRGDLDRALHWGLSALTVARQICADGELAAVCLDVATAYSQRGDSHAARAVIAEFTRQVHADPISLGVASLVTAETYLTESRFEVALSSAREGERLLTAVHSDRFLGSAFRVEAEALEAMGERAAARRCIDDSVQLLESNGHPFTLRRAYLCSGRISKNRAHLTAARELDAMLRA